MDNPRSFDIKVPLSWNALSQEQLRFLLETIVAVQNANSEYAFRSVADFAVQSRTMVASLCLFRWNNIKVDGFVGNYSLLLVQGGQFDCPAAALSEAVSLMEWVAEVPKFPVRLDTIGECRAAEAQLNDLPFAKFLALENLWQGYIATKNDDRLLDMAAILYGSDSLSPSQPEILGVFYWWASVKQLFSDLYPHFFRLSDSDSAAPDFRSLQRNMDTQIRALSKGDITKEKLILASDCRRALTELDALAEEYEEIKRKYPDHA